jgi:hypothetical protein
MEFSLWYINLVCPTKALLHLTLAFLAGVGKAGTSASGFFAGVGSWVVSAGNSKKRKEDAI